jgi:hypothetical protein
MKPTRGIPAWIVHVMDVPFVEQMTGHAPGDYARDPKGVYLKFQRLAGSCFNDQFIPDNPLTMTNEGYDSSKERGATTGAHKVVLDGIAIDSPEAVVEHMEKFVFPGTQKRTRELAQAIPKLAQEVLENELRVQARFGNDLLKVPYVFSFPALRYGSYGYENYLMAYALYPDVLARDFALQAEYSALRNQAIAQAVIDGGLPRLIRLDHDMADSRSTLVDIKSLDKIWFPQFAKAIKPLLDAGIRLIWHCDGNLMQMVPRLIEAGVSGFQGFQYEDGMDYEKICRMKDRTGNSLFIVAGVSVTRTLPFGTKEDVVKQMRWLVDNGPREGLSLGASSSIAPNTNRENIKTMLEGLSYYREHGRATD